MTDDTLAERLAAIREREQAATPGPWWSDESDSCWRLHGVHGHIPAQMFPGTDEVMIPEQVINHQILKAPKRDTPYAEYWPGDADAEFIVAARSDIPRLLAAVKAVLAIADGLHFTPCSLRAIQQAEFRDAITRALTGEPDATPPAPEAPPGSSETESAYVLRRLAETAAGLPATVLPLTGPERDHLGAEFRREYREARAPGKDTPS